MKVKNTIAMMLAVTMITSMFAACSAGSQDTAEGTTAAGTAAVEGDNATAAQSDESLAAQDADGDTITFPLAETMEFTSFSGMNQEYTLGDNLSMQTAMENANIHITFDSVLGADLTEKRNLLLASGEYTDMFFKK